MIKDRLRITGVLISKNVVGNIFTGLILNIIHRMTEELINDEQGMGGGDLSRDGMCKTNLYFETSEWKSTKEGAENICRIYECGKELWQG